MKLVDLGLVREEENGFVVDKVIVEGFLRIRKILIPFQAAYIVFFSSTLLVLSSILALEHPFILTPFEFIAIATAAAALVVSIYELWRTIRNMP
jgi:hypothetical protein